MVVCVCVCVQFMICSMAFCTFSVSSNFPQNRLQLSFILLLTNVSFKFVVNQSLPMISYLTILVRHSFIYSSTVKRTVESTVVILDALIIIVD